MKRTKDADSLFEKGWEEINIKIQKLREDLELAERKKMGDQTKLVIKQQLISLEKMISEYESKWLEFEQNLRELKKRIGVK
jgi:hypothetical protein